MIEIQYVTIRKDVPGREVEVYLTTDEGSLEGEVRGLSVCLPSDAPPIQQALAWLDKVCQAMQTRYSKPVTVREIVPEAEVAPTR